MRACDTRRMRHKMLGSHHGVQWYGIGHGRYWKTLLRRALRRKSRRAAMLYRFAKTDEIYVSQECPVLESIVNWRND